MTEEELKTLRAHAEAGVASEATQQRQVTLVGAVDAEEGWARGARFGRLPLGPVPVGNVPLVVLERAERGAAAYCVDIDPHKPCMCTSGWVTPSPGPYVRIMQSGSTTLKPAVYARWPFFSMPRQASLYAR